MSTQPRHDVCPEDNQPCWTEAGGWRCGTSQCGQTTRAYAEHIEWVAAKVPGSASSIRNRGRKTELDGQSGLPRFSPYAIPPTPDPKSVACPYCVRRPRNLKAHCQAMHPDKPEAR